MTPARRLASSRYGSFGFADAPSATCIVPVKVAHHGVTLIASMSSSRHPLMPHESGFAGALSFSPHNLARHRAYLRAYLNVSEDGKI